MPVGVLAENSLAMGIRRDPAGRAERLFGVRLWRGPSREEPGQAELLESIFRNRLTLGETGHSVGKTFLVAVAAVLWILSHPGNSRVIIVSAGWDLVRTEIFPTISFLVVRFNERFPDLALPMPLKTEWSLFDPALGIDQKVIGCSPDHMETIMRHARDGVLVLADEASHLTADIYRALSNVASSPKDHIALVGNPVRTDGPYADRIRAAEQRQAGREADEIMDPGTGRRIEVELEPWALIQIPSLRSPNIVAGDEGWPGLATRSWLARQKVELGEGTPEWQARVLGRLPDQDVDSFIARSLVLECGKRPLVDWRPDTNLTLGCDVAYSLVGDESVIVVRGDRAVHSLWKKYGATPDELFDKIGETVERFHVPGEEESRISKYRVFVDRAGIGDGLYRTLVKAGYPETCGVQSGAAALNASEYENRRAEMWASMKKALETLAIPSRENNWDGENILSQLISDLTTLHYHPSRRSERLVMESKEDYKKRVGRSPDVGDGLAFTFAAPLGKAAFPAIGEYTNADGKVVRLGFTPHRIEILTRRRITNSGRTSVQWVRHYAGDGEANDRVGVLARAMWLSRREDSACVWVHVQPDGVKTVYDSFGEEGVPARAFFEEVVRRSGGHRYRLDGFSASEDSLKVGDLHVADMLAQVARQLKVPSPEWIDPKRIAGARGLHEIDRLIVSMATRYADAPYWSGRPEGECKRLMDKAMLIVGSKPVYEALIEARYKPTGDWSTDPGEIEKEALVGGGGPYVRCLRMIEVAGA